MSAIGTKLDANQVLKQSYDEGINRIRVDANLSASIGDVSIVDSDGDELQVNPDGSLNVNVTVDAAGGDNIAISDGVDTLDINPDGSIDVNIVGLTVPTIANITTVLAATEYSYAFPANTKKLLINARGTGKIKLSFASGQSGTNFITIFPGDRFEEMNITAGSVTAYFQTNKANEVIEILSWA